MKLLNRIIVACTIFGTSISIISCGQQQTSGEIFIKSLEKEYYEIVKKPESEQQSAGSLSDIIQDSRSDPQGAEDAYQIMCDIYKKHNGSVESYTQEVFELYSKEIDLSDITEEEMEALQGLARFLANEADAIYWPALKKAGCILE